MDSLDACGGELADHEGELAYDTICPFCLGCTKGQDIVAGFRHLKVEGLLSHGAKTVGGVIADIDGGRVGLRSDDLSIRTFLDVDVNGRE